MEKVSQVIGRAIVEAATGTVIAHVRDVVTDAEQQSIAGFLIREATILTEPQVVPFDAVQMLGPDALIVPNMDAIIEQQVTDGTHTVRGASVLTESGRYLGAIDDIAFHEETGDITGYDISAGLFRDAYTGKSYLPSEHVIAFGQDVVFVDAAAEGVIDSQVGGVKKVMEDATEKTKETIGDIRSEGAPILDKVTGGVRKGAEDVKAQVQDVVNRREEIGADAKRKLGQVERQAESAFGVLRERVKELTEQGKDWLEERRIKNALGRPVTRVIYDRRDGVIINAGDIITHVAVERARAEGALDMLLSSVAYERPDFTSTNIRA